MRVSELSQKITDGLSRRGAMPRQRIEIEFDPRQPLPPVEEPLGTSRGAFHGDSGPELVTVESQYTELPTDTIIHTDIKITGNVHSAKKLIIEGTIEGDVDGNTVIVGCDGRVVGNITAEKIIVQGRVTGSIRGASVDLYNTAKIKGEVIHQGIGIEKGTHFDGMLQWDDNPGEATHPIRQRVKTAATVDALKHAVRNVHDTGHSYETIVAPSGKPGK